MRDRIDCLSVTGDSRSLWAAPSPRQAAFGIRTLVRYEPVREPPNVWSTIQVSCHGFLQWWTMIWKCKPTEPFLPAVTFGPRKTRTLPILSKCFKSSRSGSKLGRDVLYRVTHFSVIFISVSHLFCYL